jgi:hypothetical protein
VYAFFLLLLASPINTNNCVIQEAYCQLAICGVIKNGRECYAAAGMFYKCYFRAGTLYTGDIQPTWMRHDEHIAKSMGVAPRTS